MYLSTVSCVNIRSQSFVFNDLISCHGPFKATKKSSLCMLKLSELINSSARYQNPRDMRFLRAGRLYFNNDDVSFCAILNEKKNKFYLR